MQFIATQILSLENNPQQLFFIIYLITFTLSEIMN
jgi:hypothetical protein